MRLGDRLAPWLDHATKVPRECLCISTKRSSAYAKESLEKRTHTLASPNDAP